MSYDLFMKPKSEVVSIERFQPLFHQYKNKMQGNAYYFYYESVPNDIKKAIQNLAPIDLGTLERLPFDQVLNQELVEKYTP